MGHKDRSIPASVAGDHDDDPQTSSEHGGADSPSSALSPKKGRRGIQKRVVSVPVADVEGSRPSDSWAWRKYGQKPIKGSPYPRGYYRCSSSKGCPARKQVERSHVDPTMILVSYSGDHNHSLPAPKNPPSSAAAPATPSPPTTPQVAVSDTDDVANADVEDTVSEEDRRELISCAVELGLGCGALGDFSWLSDVAIEAPSFVGPSCDDDADVAMPSVGLGMREEDESLFADLDELPECSAVFRRGRGMSTCNLGSTASAPLCSRTG